MALGGLLRFDFPGERRCEPSRTEEKRFAAC
jgi:hypothetical protein